VLRGLATGFGREFGIEGQVRNAVRSRFRRERAALVRLLEPAEENDGGLPERSRAGLRILAERSARSMTPAAALRSFAGTRRLERPLEDIAGSLLHMHANRMFRSAARQQETVLYHFLERIYDARLARAGIRGRDRGAMLQARRPQPGAARNE
jgi:thiopeptide-type bacteriocin biosynthesis protein